MLKQVILAFLVVIGLGAITMNFMPSTSLESTSEVTSRYSVVTTANFNGTYTIVVEDIIDGTISEGEVTFITGGSIVVDDMIDGNLVVIVTKPSPADVVVTMDVDGIVIIETVS